MRHYRLLLVPLVVALALASSAHADDTVLAEVDQPTPIRSYADVQVWSAFDGSAYRLTIRRAGVIETLPVAPSRVPFDVDVGPDRNGRPQLVYTRCARRGYPSGAASANGGCDVFTYSPAAGTAERPVRGVNTAADEFAPALWRGRIAFARFVGRRGALAYTRLLNAPRSQRSQRLPGAGSVIELDLRGATLGEIAGPAGSIEVRLVDVTRRKVRRLQRSGAGEGGQSMVGIGFAGDHLAWGLNCLVSCGPRLLAGIYRYDLSTGALARATPALDAGGALAGVALFAPDGAYLTDAHPEEDGCGDPPAPGMASRRCRVVQSRPIAFRPVTLGRGSGAAT